MVGTGFCSALTTYSTFGYETLYAGMNVIVSVIAGLGAALLTYITTSAIIS